MTHKFEYTFSSLSKQAESTQIRSRRKRKLSCALRRACVLEKSAPASLPANRGLQEKAAKLDADLEAENYNRRAVTHFVPAAARRLRARCMVAVLDTDHTCGPCGRRQGPGSSSRNRTLWTQPPASGPCLPHADARITNMYQHAHARTTNMYQRVCAHTHRHTAATHNLLLLDAPHLVHQALLLGAHFVHHRLGRNQFAPHLRMDGVGLRSSTSPPHSKT